MSYSSWISVLWKPRNFIFLSKNSSSFRSNSCYIRNLRVIDVINVILAPISSDWSYSSLSRAIFYKHLPLYKQTLKSVLSSFGRLRMASVSLRLTSSIESSSGSSNFGCSIVMVGNSRSNSSEPLWTGGMIGSSISGSLCWGSFLIGSLFELFRLIFLILFIASCVEVLRLFKIQFEPYFRIKKNLGVKKVFRLKKILGLKE